MNRREAIKLGSALLGGATVGALAGYGAGALKNDSANIEQIAKDAFKIEPKQTAPYEYSTPMPFSKRLIDDLYQLNKKITKGKITTLYSSLPPPLGGSIHFLLDSSNRGENKSIQSVDQYLEYVKYATEKGFKCSYALNSTRHTNKEDEEGIFKTIIPLFKKMHANGIKSVKIANPAVIHFFEQEMPEDLEIQLSTTSEYHSIQTYKNLIRVSPRIKAINIATDENHNLEFIKELKTLFPDIKIEVLVNEFACIKNCPMRYYHPGQNAALYPCKDIISNNPFLHLAKNNLIHPWQLEYYSAIGVNNFKFALINVSRHNMTDNNHIKNYLDCVENGIGKYKAKDLLDKIYYAINWSHMYNFNKKHSLAKLIESLPDINVLIAKNARCATDCGVNCTYCYKFVDKLNELV